MGPQAEKSIHVEFTQDQVEHFNTSNSKLCFSAGMTENQSFNLIAQAQEISAFVTITWKDQYMIAGTKTTFQSGSKILINTASAEIQEKQTWTLPKTWGNGTVTEENLGTGKFKMVNHTTGRASAVVYKIIDGKQTPFYISAIPIEPNGSEVMSPKSTVSLWFESNAETGTMVSKNASSATVFDYRGVTAKTVHYDGGKFKDGGLSH